MADLLSPADRTAGDHGAGPIHTASVVSIHKVAHLTGAAVSVVVLPRLLGADDFGRFAFVLSLSYLGQIAGDFGTLDVLAHFVPTAATEDRSRFYSRTLAFKLAVAPVCGAAATVVALVLADWMRIGWAVAVGVGVALHIVAWVPYQFALAERQVGTWMTEQSWRQWLTLGGIVLLYPAIGFTGALGALVASEALFCIGGLLWFAHAFDREQLRLDTDHLAPLVRFGLGFFAANVATVVLYRSGPLLVAVLTSSTLETGCIELALGLFLVAYVTISHFAQSLLPVLSAGRQDPDRMEMRRWLAGFLRVGMVTAVVAAAAVWLTADWGAPLVFGRALGAAAAPIKVITLAIPAAVLAWAGNVLATACGRPGSRMTAALLAMAVFLLVALIAIPSAGAVGAAAAVGAAVTVHALVLWRVLRHELDLVACLVGRGRRHGSVTGTDA